MTFAAKRSTRRKKLRIGRNIRTNKARLRNSNRARAKKNVSSKRESRLPDVRSLRGSASAVVSACNEERTIGAVLHELKKLPLKEIIVVVNGCTDRSLEAALNCQGITVIHEPDALGHDVGRALGAKLTRSDIVLFVDGDFPIPASSLSRLITAVDGGVDVALNNVVPFLGPFKYWDDVTRVKQFLNCSLGRRDLSANSMTAVPHALSRKALTTIGTSILSVPPKAHAAAINNRLNIRASTSIDVFSRNRHRMHNTGSNNRVARLIVGDHIEALQEAQRHGGLRLSMTDRVRRRDVLGGAG